jgi:hypothetical protein
MNAGWIIMFLALFASSMAGRNRCDLANKLFGTSGLSVIKVHPPCIV